MVSRPCTPARNLRENYDNANDDDDNDNGDDDCNDDDDDVMVSISMRSFLSDDGERGLFWWE